MISLPLPPKITHKKQNHAVFEIEGLYPGYGVTIGNSLRRVLLSSLEGVAVTEFNMKGVAHEFSAIPGVLEDAVMISLNVKNLRFKIFEGDSFTLELHKKGEGAVTGKDFKLPPQVELANPELHLATVTEKGADFRMEIKIEKGIGYVPAEQQKGKKSAIGTITLDAIYTPIKNVNFHVDNMRVGDRTDFNKLSLEIETDGTISPEAAFFKACEILINHYNVIFEGNAAKAAKPASGSSAELMDALKTPVEELKLSARTVNVLVENGIKAVDAIVKKTEKELEDLEGMGEKSLTEIKKKIKKLGFELKQ